MITQADVVAAFAAGVTGIVFTFFGVLGNHHKERLVGETAESGENKKVTALVLFFFSSCVVTAFFIGIIMDYAGYPVVLTVGLILTGVCMIILAWTRRYAIALAFSIVLGPAVIALCVGANSLFPKILFVGEDGGQAAAANVGNAFFGVGALLFPFIVNRMSSMIRGVEKAVTGVAIVIILMSIPTLLTTFPQPSSGFVMSDAFYLAGQLAVLLSAGALFFYCALEATFFRWLVQIAADIFKKDIPQALKSLVDVDKLEAAAAAFGGRAIQTFVAAVIAGRLLASQVPEMSKIGGFVVLGLGIVLAVLILALMRVRTRALTLTVVALLGAAAGPVFPTLVGTTFFKYSAEVLGAIFGVIFAIGLAGAAGMPYLMAALADRIKARPAAESSTMTLFQRCLPLLIPCALLMALLSLALMFTEGTMP
jgi:fucose permease